MSAGTFDYVGRFIAGKGAGTLDYLGRFIAGKGAGDITLYGSVYRRRERRRDNSRFSFAYSPGPGH